jgi:DNA helicase-2/ATP-dependent DNA helicase PcrA
MSDTFKGLNPKQLEAVRDTVHQSALVLAGAGSGKTTVLSRRIAYLREIGIDPSSMMAITFTNKASLEMQERIAKLIGEQDAKKISMGTFHKICILMLKKFGDRIGIDPKFSIADPSDQTQAIRQALINHNQDTAASSVKNVSAFISDVKNKMFTPEGLFNVLGTGAFPMADVLQYNLYKDYQTRLTKMNMLDFDDLLMYAVRLLQQSEEVRTYYQKRFRFLMVDEYQDTNPCQYELIKLIAGKAQPTQTTPANTFVVGDDFQGIYSFRGSDHTIILNFENDFPEAMEILLEQNYRSTKAIVHVGNHLIKNNINQKKKTLFTANENGEKIKVFRAYKGEEESQFIAGEIQNLVAYGGFDYKDIAILYRTNFLSREAETQLINKRIPYRIVGGVGFYDRMEIKDTLAYLKLVSNPKDDVAMERVLSITPAIGKTTIDLIKENADMMGLSLTQAVKLYKPSRKTAIDAFDTLRNLLQELYLIYQVTKSEQRKDPVSKMMEIMWKRTAYKERLKDKTTKETLGRIDNLKELEGVAKLYESTTEDPTLDDFLDGVILNTASDATASEDTVNLMTIHASKGLEYPVVFIMGCNEEILPHKMSMDTPDGLEEERRLAYVAITRAKKLSYMSYAKVRTTYAGTQTMNPSRFIDELPKEAITFIQ